MRRLKRRRITADWLREERACRIESRHFNRLHPEGVWLTLPWLIREAEKPLGETILTGSNAEWLALALLVEATQGDESRHEYIAGRVYLDDLRYSHVSMRGGHVFDTEARCPACNDPRLYAAIELIAALGLT